MDNPRSGGAMPLGDQDLDSLWDFDFGLQALFPHEPDNNVTAGSIPGFAVGAPSCASQAVRAPHASNLSAGYFYDAAPAAAHNSAAVPPATLSDIARVYAATQSRRSSFSAQHPSNVTANETCPPPAVDAARWPPYNANLLGQNVAHAPLQTLTTRVDFGTLPPVSSSSGPSFDQALAFSGALPPWNPSANPHLDTPVPDHHLDLSRRVPGLTANPVKTSSHGFPAFCATHRNSSPASTTLPPQPRPTPTQHLHRSRPSLCSPTLSTGVPHPPLSVPGSPLPRCQPARREPELRASSTPSLAIVQYKPIASTEPGPSRKRPALEEVAPQGLTSRTLREVSLQDEHGKVNGSMLVFGNPAKKRAVFTEEKRRRTAQARRDGVCPRCKRSKRQCDLAQQLSPYVSCSLCSGSKLYKNTPRMPCFRGALAEIIFFRAGPASNEPFFTRRRPVFELKDLSKPNVSVKTLRLTQRIGSHQLTVYASEFVPQPGDVVSYTWQDPDGMSYSRKMPPFCLTNLDKVHTQIRQYIDSAKWDYLASLEGEDPLAWMTVSAAMQYARSRPDSLVADSLDLWAISRIIEIPWEICSSERLNITPVMGSTNPHHQKILLPPIMDTQLDQIVIQFILDPLRRKILAKFEHLITPAKRETFFEFYLSSFILLSHIERLAKHSYLQARRHTMPACILKASISRSFGVADVANTVRTARGDGPMYPSWKMSFTRPSPSSPGSTLSATDLCPSNWIGLRPRPRPWQISARIRSSSCDRRRPWWLRERTMSAACAARTSTRSRCTGRASCSLETLTPRRCMLWKRGRMARMKSCC